MILCKCNISPKTFPTVIFFQSKRYSMSVLIQTECPYAPRPSPTHPAQILALKLILLVMVFGGENLGGACPMPTEPSRMTWVSYKRDPWEPLVLSENTLKILDYKLGGQPSLDTSCISNTLILDFPVSRTVRNKSCCL